MNFLQILKLSGPKKNSKIINIWKKIDKISVILICSNNYLKSDLY